jgi:hypothetical protein
VLSIKVFVIAAKAFVSVQIMRWAIQVKPTIFFASDKLRQRKSCVTDQKKRDDVIKQNFSINISTRERERENARYVQPNRLYC